MIEEDKKTPYDLLGYFPRKMQPWLLKKVRPGGGIKAFLRGNPQELVDTIDEYQGYSLMRIGEIVRAQLMVMKFPGVGMTDILTDDKLGNPEIKFPIAAAFGDRDFMYSENGAERVIKANCHYETGRSQLFKIDDCTHFMP